MEGILKKHSGIITSHNLDGHIGIVSEEDKYVSIKPMESFTLSSEGAIKSECDRDCPNKAYYKSSSGDCYCFDHMFINVNHI